MSRPKLSDYQIVDKAAKLLAPEVVAWLGDDTEFDGVVVDLASAMRWGAIDGYELAQCLDRDGYSPDAALVEILDGADNYLREALKEASEEWVKDEGLVPPPLGMPVTEINNPKNGIGIIKDNLPDGRSVVSFESLGHGIKKENSSCTITGSILEWEKLAKAE